MCSRCAVNTCLEVRSHKCTQLLIFFAVKDTLVHTNMRTRGDVRTLARKTSSSRYGKQTIDPFLCSWKFTQGNLEFCCPQDSSTTTEISCGPKEKSLHDSHEGWYREVNPNRAEETC